MARLFPVAVILFIGAMLAVLAFSSVSFADEHGDAGKLEHKVDLENQSGMNLIIAELYNDHRLLFALVATATMALVGIIIGHITGIILRLLGLK